MGAHALFLLFLDHRGFLGDVEAVEELPDVLVLHGGALLDEGCRLRDGLDTVAGENQLILEGGRTALSLDSCGDEDPIKI